MSSERKHAPAVNGGRKHAAEPAADHGKRRHDMVHRTIRRAWGIGLFAALVSAASAAPSPTGREPALRREMVVTTRWLAARSGKPGVVVLHVATDPAHYQAGHLPGARLLRWAEVADPRNGVPNELPPVASLRATFERLGVGETARIVLYGDGAGLSAARAWFALDYLGHGGRASLLDGGIERWRAEGRPVARAVPPARPAPFRPRLRPGRVIALDAVRDVAWSAAHLAPSPVALIDARPGEEYRGEKPGEGIDRPGHLPGAASLFWRESLVSQSDPRLRPVGELRRRIRAAGAAAGRPVVTYCRTGGQASHVYFVARYLGYDASLYDGSFIEWSRAGDTPVETGRGR